MHYILLMRNIFPVLQMRNLVLSFFFFFLQIREIQNLYSIFFVTSQLFSYVEFLFQSGTKSKIECLIKDKKNKKKEKERAVVANSIRLNLFFMENFKYAIIFPWALLISVQLKLICLMWSFRTMMNIIQLSFMKMYR